MTTLRVLLALLIILALGFGALSCGSSGKGSGPAPVSAARKSSLQTDLSLVKTAVDAYFLQASTVPTDDGRLPPAGEYALIDFDASFVQNGSVLRLHPDLILELPRHHDEGVWRVDSGMQVSVGMASADY